jgi:peptide/nickel transport system permease protein
MPNPSLSTGPRRGPTGAGSSLVKRVAAGLRYIRRNPAVSVGVLLLLSLLLFSVIGAQVWDVGKSAPLSGPASRPPNAQHPLGTDQQGRDMLAAMIAGTPLTLRVGIVAGLLGTGLGTLLAFMAGYYRGPVDTFIRGVVDVGLTVPSLLVLIIIAISLEGNLSVNQMALIVASTAWLWPARTIRSQVLTLRERTWVQMARLSGVGSLEIIVRELMPNLIPALAASLVNTVSQAILASIGLEALGLGPMDAPTLGMTLYWAIYNSALLHGMWWHWAPPIVIIVVLFVGLFLLSVGLDEIANPRLRRAA